jgi:hypothetical protein
MGGRVEYIPNNASCPIEGQRDIPILYERNDFIMTEAAKEARRAYYREYQRRWRKEHRLSIREYQRNWRKQNPMRLREYQERYWQKRAFEKSFDRAELNAETD